MITINNQLKLFENISKKLKKKLVIYAIGGTAMMFLGFKDVTLDIDLVFENSEDKRIFKDAIKSLGYSELDSTIVYGGREDRPEMLTRGDERFDLFVDNVIDFIFSENMRKRAQTKHQFNENLTLKIANPHDIILMKCATDRIKDMEDAKNIIKNFEIDWKLLLDEMKAQLKLGKKRAAFDLGDFFERLEKEGIKTPEEITKKIWDIVCKEAEKNK